MIEYRVIKGENSIFGIEAVKNGTVLERVEGLFEDEAEAAKLAELCTRLELSPLHLPDIAMDVIFMKASQSSGRCYSESQVL